MAQLNKQQLEQVNQANFPDNTAGLITPAVLRDFNTDIIDSMALVSSSIGISQNGTSIGSVGALNFSGSLRAMVTS